MSKEYFVMLIKNLNEESRKEAKKYGFKYNKYYNNYTKYTEDESLVWELNEIFTLKKANQVNLKFDFIRMNKN